MILICDTECWTEPRPATTGNIKIKKQALVSPALSKCIGCWHWLEKIIVLSESRARRNGAALCRTVKWSCSWARHNNKFTANNDYFVPQPPLKWVLDIIFSDYREKNDSMNFAIAATPPIINDPIQWRAGAASVTLALSAFFALLPV